MKYNYFLIPSLPDIVPDGTQEFTMKEFVDANADIFDNYRSGVDKIIFINELKNLELVLKSKLDMPEGLDGNRGSEFEYFQPAICTVEEIERFIDDPVSYAPDDYSEDILEFFENIKDNSERYKRIEELYVRYFTPDANETDFFSYALNVMSVQRTVSQAVRLSRLGLNLEENLIGDEDVVRTILENRSSSDFGLSSQYPFVSDIVSAFDKDIIALEHEMDKIIYEAVMDYKEEDLFGDHVIYAFLIGLFVLDRWQTMDEEQGQNFIDNLLQA